MKVSTDGAGRQAMEKMSEGLQHLQTAAKDEAYRKRILHRLSSDVVRPPLCVRACSDDRGEHARSAGGAVEGRDAARGGVVVQGVEG